MWVYLTLYLVEDRGLSLSQLASSREPTGSAHALWCLALSSVTVALVPGVPVAALAVVVAARACSVG
jgi:hypothetical protein